MRAFKVSLPQLIRSLGCLILSSSFMAVPGGAAQGGVTYHALCSLYTEYKDCNVTVKPDLIAANFADQFIVLSPADTISVGLYDSRRLEPNYAIGIATTVILGPLGLLGFLVQKKIGDVDFGFTYRDGARKKTAFVRFKNNAVTRSFSNSIKPFLLALSQSGI